MITHEQMLQTTIGADENGCTVASVGKNMHLIFESTYIDADFVNLFRASSAMYTTLNNQVNLLGALIESCETVGNDRLAGILIENQANIKLIQEIAIKGVAIIKKV